MIIAGYLPSMVWGIISFKSRFLPNEHKLVIWDPNKNKDSAANNRKKLNIKTQGYLHQSQLPPVLVAPVVSGCHRKKSMASSRSKSRYGSYLEWHFCSFHPCIVEPAPIPHCQLPVAAKLEIKWLANKLYTHISIQKNVCNIYRLFRHNNCECLIYNKRADENKANYRNLNLL